MSDVREQAAQNHNLQWQKKKVEAYFTERDNYVEYTRFLEAVLKNACKALSPLAFIQTRAKEVSSYAEKIVRKLDKFQQAGYDFTDLCGARIIVHTSDDVIKICQWVEKNFIIDADNSLDAADRLQSDKFGYLSVHYVVTLKPQAYFDQVPPAGCIGLKAELQVRTLLQHAWADIMHDRFYKNRHDLPDNLKRECSRIAAVLENTDMDILDLIHKLDIYDEHYSVFIDIDKLKDEISKLKTILQLEPDDKKKSAIALKLMKLMASFETWEEMISIIEALPEGAGKEDVRDNLFILRGQAYCRLGLLNNREDYISKGISLLETVIEQEISTDESLYPGRAANIALACCILRNIYLKKGHIQEAYQAALKAYSHQPENPYILADCLYHEARPPVTITLMRPLFDQACKACNSHIAVGIELPRAFFAKARFLYLSGEITESAKACCEGIEHLRKNNSDNATDLLAQEVNFYKTWSSIGVNLTKVGEDLPKVVVETALFALTLQNVKEETSKFFGYHSVPEAIWLAGQLNALDKINKNPSVNEFIDVLKQYDGILLEKKSIMEWSGIIKKGIQPEKVMLLYTQYSSEDELEQMVALSLGAVVVCIEPDMGKMAIRRAHHRLSNHANLYIIPHDKASLRAFIQKGAMPLMDYEIDSLGKVVHAEYLNNDFKGLPPELRPWETLSEDFKASSISQALFASIYLRICGYSLRKVDKEPNVIKLSQEEIEKMAEMEHGRFVAERIREGWTYNIKKSKEHKLSPCLVSWSELSEYYKDFDRHAMEKIPNVFANAGYEIYR